MIELNRKRISNLQINLNAKKHLLRIRGRLGTIEKKYGGSDIFFMKNSIFLKSKSSFKNLLQLIDNSVKGTSNGYFVEINFVGLGYQFIKFGKYILLKLGYSHYIRYELKKSFHIIGYRKKLIIFGMDLEEVNALINILESFKKPDNYKGKGLVVANKKIIIKIGKQK